MFFRLFAVLFLLISSCFGRFDVDLLYDGYITSSEREHLEAGRRLDEVVHTEHTEDHSVFNPCLAELLTLNSQVDEFKRVQSSFMTQRLSEGASMKQAREEAKQVTQEKVEQAKALKKERIIRKHKALETIEKELPEVKGIDSKIRAKILTDYLNTNSTKLIELTERSTLEEVKAEVDYYGDIPQEKRGFHETLLNCINESDITERELEMHTAEGIGKATGSLMIPGYSAWASGGDTTEVISSALSDIVLTIVGGKVIKVAWTGGKALYKGAKAIGREIRAAGKGTQVAKAKPKWRQSEIDVGKTLGPKAREQVSYLNGKEVRRGLEDSVRPDFVIGNSASFEVKNYTIATNKDGLIRDVVSQVKKRAIHLPKGMEQHIRIDIRGQEVTPTIKESIKQKIVEKTSGIIDIGNIKFYGEY